ncbi:unnamed protein product [Parajaminaea phylloscopi]
MATTVDPGPASSATAALNGSVRGDVEHNAEPGPSRPVKIRFRPQRHLLEPPEPPPTDHKVEEEQAAQAAAQAAGYEGRRMRRFLQRRTVDYMGSWIRYKDKRLYERSTARGDYWLKPSPHFVIDLMPSAASRSTASSAAPHLVHTSTNKIRTPVNCVTWMPSSRRLLTGSSSGEFTLWNGMTFNFETILQACDHGVRNLEWTSTGNLLLSGDAGGTVKYFLPNMNNVLAIDAHRESVRGLSFSPDDSRWISGSDDSSIKMFNTERGVEETTLKGHGWDVKCVEWHPFKGLIASGGKDNLVKFWDPRRGGREIGTFHGHKNTVQALSFSPNHISSSEILATASRDQTIKLYDLRMIRELSTLKAAPVEGGSVETGGVCSLSWHPYVPLLSSGLSTGALQHHSLAPSATPDMPISTVPAAHDQSIWAMSWHPLGHILVTGGNDCFTRWWERDRIESGDLKHQASAEDGAAAAVAAATASGGAAMFGKADQGLPGTRRRHVDPDGDHDRPFTASFAGSRGGQSAIPGLREGAFGRDGGRGVHREGSGRASPPPGFDASRNGWARDSPANGPGPAAPHRAATGANMQDGVRDLGWGARGQNFGGANGGGGHHTGGSGFVPPGLGGPGGGQAQHAAFGGGNDFGQQQQQQWAAGNGQSGGGFALPGLGGGHAQGAPLPGFGGQGRPQHQPQQPHQLGGYGYGGGR